MKDMERFAASNEDGILQLRWAPRTFVTYEIAVQAAHALAELSGSQPLPLLVDITGVTALAPEARAGMNAYRGFCTVALVGDHPMGTVISGFSRQSATPTAFFTNEAEALRWLSLQSRQQRVPADVQDCGWAQLMSTETSRNISVDRKITAT